MGRDKSRLRLGSRTLVGHLRRAARAAGFATRVIRRDLVPGCGPLGGLHTALATSRAATLVVLACDMPFVSGGLIRWLGRQFRVRRRALVVREAGRAGFPWVLRRRALPLVEARLARRDYSLQGLAKELGAQGVRVPPCFRRELANLNTRAELASARKVWRRSSLRHRALGERRLPHPAGLRRRCRGEPRAEGGSLKPASWRPVGAGRGRCWPGP